MNDDYPYRSPQDAKTWTPEWPASRPHATPDVDKPAVLPQEHNFAAPQLATIVAVVMVIASVVNATMFPVARSITPGGGVIFIVGMGYYFLVLGSLAGQLAMLTVLVVWGPGPLWLRLVWHWGLALLAVSAWKVGMIIGFFNELGLGLSPDDLVLRGLLGLPVIALAYQIAPWLLKVYRHWRIEPIQQAPEPATLKGLSIRDILYGTILVALSMAALRLGKPANAQEWIYWTGWGIATASAAGISALCLVPMVYLTLGVRRAWVGAIEVAAIAATFAVVGSVILILLNPGGPSDKEIILMMASVAAGFTITLAGTLWIARRYGYRLVTERPLMNPFGPPISAPPTV